MTDLNDRDLTEGNKALMRRFLAGLDSDIAVIDEIFSPQCCAHLPGGATVDREGFKAFVGQLYAAFPDLTHRIEHQIAEKDTVATVVVARGTHDGNFQSITPTGRTIEITDIIVARIENGRFVELWAQFDALGLLSQLG